MKFCPHCGEALVWSGEWYVWQCPDGHDNVDVGDLLKENRQLEAALEKLRHCAHACSPAPCPHTRRYEEATADCHKPSPSLAHSAYDRPLYRD